MKDSIEKSLTDFVNGELSREERQELWVYLVDHPERYNQLKVEYNLKALAQSGSSAFDESTPEKSVPIITLKTWLAVAAVLAFITIGINLLRFTESQYVDKISHAEITPGLFEPAQQFRGEGLNAAEDSSYNAALAAASAQHYEIAKQRFQDFVRDFPFSVSRSRAELNIGLILFGSKHFKDAIESFERVVTDSSEAKYIHEKAHWFSTLSYIKLEELVKARNAAFKAMQLDGAYKMDAEELVFFLDYKLGIVDMENNPFDEDFVPEALKDTDSTLYKR